MAPSNPERDVLFRGFVLSMAAALVMAPIVNALSRPDTSSAGAATRSASS